MKNIFIFLCLALSIFQMSCNSGPGFEKDKEVRVMLTLGYSDFIKAVAGEGNGQIIGEALDGIKEGQVNDFTGFINAFRENIEKTDPEAALASIFSSFGMRDLINYASTNEDVTSALKKEWDATLTTTTDIIRMRLAAIGFKNFTVKTEKGNNIIVDVKGFSDKKRIETILLADGELGFWETYGNGELFPFLQSANSYLAQESGDTTYTASPLFMLLKPELSADDTPAPGSVIGSVLIKDTAEVSRIFKMKAISELFPRDLRLLWSRQVKVNDITYFYLIAAKSDRSGGPALDGSLVVSAVPEKKKSGNEIVLKMNSVGANMLRNFTSYNIDRQIAITLDNVVYAHPRVENPVENGIASISGNFTAEEVTDLSIILRGGAYPVKPCLAVL
jgi:SecD/SecF fusion protein